MIHDDSEFKDPLPKKKPCSIVHLSHCKHVEETLWEAFVSAISHHCCSIKKQRNVSVSGGSTSRYSADEVLKVTVMVLCLHHPFIIVRSHNTNGGAQKKELF